MRRFSIQHIRPLPEGWKVRTKRVGSHELRIGFPPGRRKRGSGKLVEILHPKRENPRSCLTRATRTNPLELLVFGNPSRANHSHQNPSAENLYEQFHGEDPHELLEYADEPQAMPRKATVLGDLIAIGFDAQGMDGDQLVAENAWKKCSHISFDGDDVKVASNPSGTQLYFVGGNQDLRSQLADFGKSGASGRVRLGQAAFIVYATRKSFDDFRMSDYIHKFGEDSGVTPNYWYDVADRRVLIRGGEYRVQPDGIVN